MARANNRVVLNRACLDAITLGMADGLLALAEAVIAAAQVPVDAAAAEREHRPELIETGGTIAYVLGKKVGGSGVTKPRAMKVRSLGVAIAGGFGFPGHLEELGTINEPARPFLTPALMATLPDAGPFIEAAMANRLATVDSRAAASSTIQTRIANSGASS